MPSQGASIQRRPRSPSAFPLPSPFRIDGPNGRHRPDYQGRRSGQSENAPAWKPTGLHPVVHCRPERQDDARRNDARKCPSGEAGDTSTRKPAFLYCGRTRNVKRKKITEKIQNSISDCNPFSCDLTNGRVLPLNIPHEFFQDNRTVHHRSEKCSAAECPYISTG